jgi:hypothetical protein
MGAGESDLIRFKSLTPSRDQKKLWLSQAALVEGQIAFDH